MTEAELNVNGDVQALRCTVKDLGYYPPFYTVQHLDEIAKLSDELAEVVAVLTNYKEKRKAG